MSSLYALSIMLASSAMLVCAVVWEYDEARLGASSRWGQIRGPDGTLLYPICDVDFQTSQSPTNLVQSVVDPQLQPLSFSWVVNRNFQITNDAVEVRIVPSDAPSSVFDPNTNTTFTLRSINVHIPGEHSFGGGAADLELQFTYRAADNTSSARMYLALLFVAGDAENDALGSILDQIPDPPTRTLDAKSAFALVDRPTARVNTVGSNVLSLGPLMPLSGEYVTYNGSQTRPPCTEGGNHYVFTEMMRISAPQIAIVAQKVLGTKSRAGRASFPLTGRIARRYVPARAQHVYRAPPAQEPLSPLAGATAVALAFSLVASIASTAGFLVALLTPRRE